MVIHDIVQRDPVIVDIDTTGMRSKRLGDFIKLLFEEFPNMESLEARTNKKLRLGLVLLDDQTYEKMRKKADDVLANFLAALAA